jgi:hypothetical protein
MTIAAVGEKNEAFFKRKSTLIFQGIFFQMLGLRSDEFD